MAAIRLRPSGNIVTLSGTEVTVKADKNWGGAITSLKWNGQEFVDSSDLGRLIQSDWAFDWSFDKMPTEAGDVYGRGSPYSSASVSGKTLTTSVKPLVWQGTPVSGMTIGSIDGVVWNGTFSKTVVADYGGFTKRLKYSLSYTVPSTYSHMDVEAVTAYMPTTTFNAFYTYDATTDTMKTQTSSLTLDNCVAGDANADYAPNAGGVIIANSAGTYALGIYRQRAQPNHFALCKHSGTVASSQLTVLERGYNASGITAGTQVNVTAYLVVGTLANVKSEMRSMYLAGW